MIGRNSYTIFLIFSILLYSSIVQAQKSYIIKGTVIDSLSIPISSVSLVWSKKTDKNKIILGFTRTNNNGEFNFNVSDTGSYILTARDMRFAQETTFFNVRSVESEKNITIKMNRLNVLKIEEVIVSKTKPIIHRGDTTSFSLDYFKDGDERNLEELLKKIPGISINKENGIITVGDKEIEKIMVEGEDFFGKGYQILTKSMPVRPLDRLEIINDFQHNKFLKGIDKSDKVAMNLVLSEDSKHVWFGNVIAGISPFESFFYDGSLSLMNFSKKNKTYLTTSAGNVGKNALSYLSTLVNGDKDYYSLNNNIQTYEPINLVEDNAMIFNRERFLFNNTQFYSINNIKSIFNNKISIKSNFAYNIEKDNYFNSKTETYFSIEEPTSIKEENKLTKRNLVALGVLDINYAINSNSEINSTSTYQLSKKDDYKYGFVNLLDLNEKAQINQNRLDQNIRYINKLKNNTVLTMLGNFTYDKRQNDYSVNRNFFENLGISNHENFLQQTESNLSYWAFETSLKTRKNKNILFANKAGVNYLKSSLNNSLNLTTAAKNHVLKIINKEYYFSQNIELRYAKLISNIDLGLHYKDISTDNHVIKNRYSKLFLVPDLRFQYSLNKKNQLTLSFIHTRRDLSVEDMYQNLIVTNFRSVKQGLSDISLLSKPVYSFRYNFGNYLDKFSFSSQIHFTTNENYLAYDYNIHKDYILLNSLLMNNKQGLAFRNVLDYYFSGLKSNIKLKAIYNSFRLNQRFYTGEWELVTNKSSTLGFEIRYGSGKLINYNIGFDINRFSRKLVSESTNTNYLGFMGIDISLSKKIKNKFTLEYYKLGGATTRSNYTFLDSELIYNISSKLQLSLIGKNLTNTNFFSQAILTDISNVDTGYKLLPRYVMFKISFNY